MYPLKKRHVELLNILVPVQGGGVIRDFLKSNPSSYVSSGLLIRTCSDLHNFESENAYHQMGGQRKELTPRGLP